MIVGIGTDIISITRLKGVLEKFGEKTLDYLFTPQEQKLAQSKKNLRIRNSFYAKRFASKEAFSKAAGTGIGVVSFSQIEITNDDKGAPILTVFGDTKKYLDSIVPKGYLPRIHLSITDEQSCAVAFVIIEAIPVA